MKDWSQEMQADLERLNKAAGAQRATESQKCLAADLRRTILSDLDNICTGVSEALRLCSVLNGQPHEPGEEPVETHLTGEACFDRAEARLCWIEYALGEVLEHLRYMAERMGE